jgi:hypothetical protein
MARFGFRGFVVAYVVAAAAWLLIRRASASLGATIAVAIVLRAIFLFAEPRLSADIWRYMWDGRTLAAGRDPYARLPDDARINHPEIPTIYPPHAELAFALAHNVLLWRLLLLAADLTVIAMLRRGRLAYATFPPLLFEGAWSGHIEVLAAMLLFLAWSKRSGAAAAAAVGTKLIPIAAVPALFLRATNRWRFALVFAIVLVVPFVPFAIAGPLMPGMHAYAMRWVFNSPLYTAMFAALERLVVAAHLKAAFTSVKDSLHLEAIAPFVYFHLYTDYLTRVLLGVTAAIGITVATKRRSIAGSVGALLLCSPAIHPWYWLVIAPFASGVWLALALCAPFSYLLYDGANAWLVFALCYALPLIALLRPSANATSAAESPRAETRSRTARDTSPS